VPKMEGHFVVDTVGELVKGRGILDWSDASHFPTHLANRLLAGGAAPVTMCSFLRTGSSVTGRAMTCMMFHCNGFKRPRLGFLMHQRIYSISIKECADSWFSEPSVVEGLF
jgi:hypothetical protein